MASLYVEFIQILLFNIEKKENLRLFGHCLLIEIKILCFLVHLMHFFSLQTYLVCVVPIDLGFCFFFLVTDVYLIYWFSLYIAQLASFFAIVTDYTSKPSLKFYHLANVNVGYKNKVVSRSAQINHNHCETSALLMVLQQHHLSTYIRNYDFMIKLLLLLEGIEYKS